MYHLIKKLSPYFIAAFILILTNLVFFSPELSGKVLQQRDMIQDMARSHEAHAYYDSTGTPTYWTNSLFGGMPTYHFFNPLTKTSLFDYMDSVFGLFFSGSLRYYLILSLAAFIGLCCFGIGPWLALIGAYSIAFATNHISLVAAGHLTKIATLGFVPMIVAGTYLLFNKNWKTGFLVFTFGLAANIRNNHIQMTYFVAWMIGIYILAEIIARFKENKLKTIFRPGLALMTGVAISFFVNYATLMGLQSYAKDTMRGGSILDQPMVQNANTSSISSKSGLGWDYAMQWSEGIVDLLSIIVPGAAGGSSNEIWSQNSRMATAFRQNGIPIAQDFTLPLYWGDLPFTNGPDYIGILIALTFIMGLVLIRGPFKWFALLSALLLILQSMGNNFTLINKLFFDFIPYYNKFRAPNSILNIFSTVVPIFAMYGLYHFMQRSWTKSSLLSLFKKTVFPLMGVLIVLILAGSSFFDMKSELGDPDWKNNKSLYLALLDARATYLRSDALRSLMILTAGASLIYFFAIKKIKLTDFLMAFAVLVGIDLWVVAKRYMNADNYQIKKIEESTLLPRRVDLEILKDHDLSYRVLDLSVNTFNSAIPSYYHKSIGGDCATKLRRYQDMIDYYFSKNDMTALRMMNTKYMIDKQGVLKSIPNALGNAWFVAKIIQVNSPNKEIEALKNINPEEEVVFLQSEFKDQIIQPSYEKSGSIQLTQYTPDHLIYKSSTSGPRFAVFSEVWYGPDKGWTAMIDGHPADYVRVNYILRGMAIPEGEHIIEFKFAPKEIIANQNISYYSGNIFGVLILVYLVIGIRTFLLTPLSIVPAERIAIDRTSELVKSKSKK